jgi:hypothetical protein
VIRTRLTRLRRAGAAVASGLVMVSIVSTGSNDARAATAPAPPFVSLKGEGAWGSFEEIVPWHNQLLGAKAPIDLGYTPTGSLIGREDLLAGRADFALSGVGFTDAELKGSKHKSSDFIAAPVAVASLGILTMPPAGAHPGFQSFVVRCDPLSDPSTWPSDVPPDNPFDPVHGCQIWQPYTGRVKIPNENLAAMLLQYQLDENGGVLNEPLSSWNNSAVRAAFGVENIDSVVPKKGPTPVLRSDEDETNYYLLSFTSRFAQTVWHKLPVAFPKAKWKIAESLPRQASASRGEADQQAELLGPASDPASGSVAFGGAIADVPVSSLIAVKSTYPNANVSFAALQNAKGDWVAPTPESLTAAVAAGGTTPLYAFANKVPNAYPFTWVDNLYAPAHGLSIAKTEGLATLVRYLATAGQDAAAPVGEGRISASVEKQALLAADSIVQSNCTGSDRMIVKSSDPGPVAPPLDAMKSIPPMLHCVEAPESTATTTTVQPNTVTTLPLGSSTPPSVNPQDSSGGAFTPSSSDGTSSDGTSSGGTPSGTASPGGSARALAVSRDTSPKNGSERHGALPSALAIASKLPLSESSTSSGADRLGAFVLGVLLYLILRKPVGRLVRRTIG